MAREDEVYWAEARLGHFDATGLPLDYWPHGYAEDYEVATGGPFLPPWKPWRSRWRCFLWRLTGGAWGI